MAHLKSGQAKLCSVLHRMKWIIVRVAKQMIMMMMMMMMMMLMLVMVMMAMMAIVIMR